MSEMRESSAAVNSRLRFAVCKRRPSDADEDDDKTPIDGKGSGLDMLLHCLTS